VIDRKIPVIEVQKDRDIRNFPALQAADFLAWELRRRALQKLDFITNDKTGNDADEWLRQEVDWFLKQKGTWPSQRPSLTFLLRSQIETVVWDRRQIEIAHSHRSSWRTDDSRVQRR
jgi:hypothetical protein